MKSTRKRKPSYPTREKVLQVRLTSSPRLAWLGFLRLLRWSLKWGAIVATLAILGWTCWKGIRQHLYENPDFRLQFIDLNPNPAVTEADVAALAEIDFRTRPSLLDVSIRKTEQQLLARPDIINASVERHLPGTLKVRVTPRVPKAWLRCPSEGISGQRAPGNLLVDEEGHAYPAPATISDTTQLLPVIELPPSASKPIRPGTRIVSPALTNAFLLLDAASAADPTATQWIESISQPNAWSLQLLTRNGTVATFGLGDHPRQMANFRTALDHATSRGYQIDTINLIPKFNIPITISEEPTPPRALPVVLEE